MGHRGVAQDLLRVRFQSTSSRLQSSEGFTREMCSQHCSRTWLLAGSPSLHDMVALASPSTSDLRVRTRRQLQCLLWPSLLSHTPSLLPELLIMTRKLFIESNPHSMGGGSKLHLLRGSISQNFWTYPKITMEFWAAFPSLSLGTHLRKIVKVNWNAETSQQSLL